MPTVFLKTRKQYIGAGVVVVVVVVVAVLVLVLELSNSPCVYIKKNVVDLVSLLK